MICQSKGRGLRTAILGSTALWASSVSGCGPSYRAPALPAEQLAVVTLDSRVSTVEVDGLPVAAGKAGPAAREFPVGPGCRKFAVKYEESYFIWGEKKAKKEGLGAGLGAALAKTEVHDYETMRPILFFIPTKPGRKYWITATFTGDEFLPRVVESDSTDTTTATFLAEQPCGTNPPP